MNHVINNLREILVNDNDKKSIVSFFVDLIKYNDDPILDNEVKEYFINTKRDLKNICVICGIAGSGKTTLIKYLCEKLQIRECHYEPLTKKEIEEEREINRENDYKHYYHPFIDFIEDSQFRYMDTRKEKNKCLNKNEDSDMDKNEKKKKICLNKNEDFNVDRNEEKENIKQEYENTNINNENNFTTSNYYNSTPNCYNNTPNYYNTSNYYCDKSNSNLNTSYNKYNTSNNYDTFNNYNTSNNKYNTFNNYNTSNNKYNTFNNCSTSNNNYNTLNDNYNTSNNNYSTSNYYKNSSEININRNQIMIHNNTYNNYNKNDFNEYNISENKKRNDIYKNYLKKREKRKRKYYDEHYIKTRITIIDELPNTYLDHSEEFKKNCNNTIKKVFDYVDFCKKKKKLMLNNEDLYIRLKDLILHGIVILINYDDINNVNSLLGINIANSSYVSFIKLKKIDPIYHEKLLIEKYYYQMINSNNDIKEIIKYYTENCNGDIRSCFITLDFLNRNKNIKNISLKQIKEHFITKMDVLEFTKKILYRDIGSEKKEIRNHFYYNYDMYFDYNYTFNELINIKYIDTIEITNENEKNNETKNNNENEKNNETEKNNENEKNKNIIINNEENKYNTIQNDLRKKKLELFKDLDNKVNLMNHHDRLTAFTYLKNNFLFFYNAMDDISQLSFNISYIYHKLGGLFNSFKYDKNLESSGNEDFKSLVNNNFKLIYKYFIICNNSPRIPIGNPDKPKSFEPHYTLEYINKKQKEYAIYNQKRVNNFFCFKMNETDKCLYEYTRIYNSLYKKYFEHIRKIYFQNVDNKYEYISLYNFLNNTNPKVFMNLMPFYIYIIINYWNKKKNIKINENINKYNEIINKYNENINKYDEDINKYDEDINKYDEYINKYDGNIEIRENVNKYEEIYFNKFQELSEYLINDSNKSNNNYENTYKLCILFLETIITPRFIAIFFPKYIKYLKDYTKEKKNINTIISDSSISHNKCSSLKNIYNLNHTEFHNFFFKY